MSCGPTTLRSAAAVASIGAVLAERDALRERAAIAEADADRLAEALEVTAAQADSFQQGNVDRLLAAHREAVASRPADDGHGRRLLAGVNTMASLLTGGRE